MFAWIATHPYAYPLLEALHIVGIALLLGNLVLFELRVFGLGRGLPVHALARLALPLSLAGFVLVAGSGLTMFASRPDEFLGNRAFIAKMGLVLAAGVNAALFHARGGPARLDALARSQAVLSLGLWLAVLGCGRWIAYCRSDCMHRRSFVLARGAAVLLPAAAHHGWSSFDQDRPLYLEGRAASVAWRNPHVELDLELKPGLALPADLKQRTLPPQSANVDGAKLLANAQLPTRRDTVWHIELAPLTRMQAWKVAEIKAGTLVSVLGFTFAGEKGEPILRAEYLFVDGQAYGLRSAPA